MMRLSRWARAALLTGAILLGIGVLPLTLTSAIAPGAVPLLFIMAFYLLTPLGAAILIFGILLFLIALLRR